MAHKQGVFEEKKEEYWQADKKRKGEILKSVSDVTGMKRKACIKRFRKMQMKDSRISVKRGRPVYFTQDVVAALKEVWEIGSEACGENLHPMIGEYIDSQIKAKQWKHDDIATFKLRRMSVGSAKKYVRIHAHAQKLRRKEYDAEKQCHLDGAHSHGRMERG